MHCSTPVFLYSGSTVLLYSCYCVLVYSCSPVLLYSSTPVLMYSCTSVLLFLCTCVLLFSCTPVLLDWVKLSHLQGAWTRLIWTQVFRTEIHLGIRNLWINSLFNLIMKKSCIWQTLTFSMCVDNSNDTKKWILNTLEWGSFFLSFRRFDGFGDFCTLSNWGMRKIQKKNIVLVHFHTLLEGAGEVTCHVSKEQVTYPLPHLCLLLANIGHLTCWSCDLGGGREGESLADKTSL